MPLPITLIFAIFAFAYFDDIFFRHDSIRRFSMSHCRHATPFSPLATPIHVAVAIITPLFTPLRRHAMPLLIFHYLRLFRFSMLIIAASLSFFQLTPEFHCHYCHFLSLFSPRCRRCFLSITISFSFLFLSIRHFHAFIFILPFLPADIFVFMLIDFHFAAISFRFHFRHFHIS
jgi:hypothetical protein